MNNAKYKLASLEAERSKLLFDLDEVCQNRRDIEKQLADARRTFASGGPASDIGWMRRAEHASLSRASEARMIQARLGEIKLEIKRVNKELSETSNNTTQHHFMNICREEMTGADFMRVLREAERRAALSAGEP